MHSNKAFRFLILMLFLKVSISCSENKKVENKLISGKIKNLPESYIVLSEVFPDRIIKIDSVMPDKNGEFEFSMDIDESKILYLEFVNNQHITLIVSPDENLEINSEYPEILKNYTISGSIESELLKEYSSYSLNNLHRIDSLRKIFEAYKNDNNFRQIREELSRQYMDVFNDQKDYVRDLINDNPGKLISLIALNRKFGQNKLFDNETDIDLLIRIDSGLSINYPGNVHTQNHRQLLIELQTYLSEKMIAEQYTSTGMPLPAFTINDTDGKRISIEALKAKPILLYFWASWDGLSRQTNYNLKDLYEKNGDYEVLAVSFDQNPETWKAAIKVDELPFINASDLKGSSSPLFILLNLPNKLPYFILTEKGGIIKYRGSDLEALKQELKQISNIP